MTLHFEQECENDMPILYAAVLPTMTCAKTSLASARESPAPRASSEKTRSRTMFATRSFIGRALGQIN